MKMTTITTNQLLELSMLAPNSTIVTLPVRHALCERFPPSCPVTSQARSGFVESVAIDLTSKSKESLYSLDGVFVPEHQLQFAKNCKVVYQGSSAKVLLSYQVNKRAIYSVQLHGGALLHGIPQNQLKCNAPCVQKLEEESLLKKKTSSIKKQVVKQEEDHAIISSIKKDDSQLRTTKVRLPQGIGLQQQFLDTPEIKQLQKDAALSCLNHVIYLSARHPSFLKHAQKQVEECILRVLPSRAERLRTSYQFALDALQPAWECQRDVPVYCKKLQTWIMCVESVEGSIRRLERKAKCINVQVLLLGKFLLIQGTKQQDVHSLYLYYQRLQQKAAERIQP